MDEGQGLTQLGELFRGIRRRWHLVAIYAVVAGAAALAATMGTTRQYQAASQVFISQTDPVSSVLSRSDTRPADPERDFNTRVALIKEPAVAAGVRRQLGLSLSDDALLAKVSTSAATTSDIVDITVRDRDPRVAAALANAFAQQYVAVRDRAARGTVLRAVALATRELASLPPGRGDPGAARELARRLRELRIDAALQTSGVEVVGRARPPSAPAGISPRSAAVLAAFLAGLLGMGIAAALELADRRIREEGDLEAFGVPVLGSLPAVRRRGGRADPVMRDALSTVATTLRLMHLRRDIGSLVIASVGSQEETAGVTLGLSAALAELGIAVTAVEADLRHPRFADEATLIPGIGLSTVLAGFADVDDAIVGLDARTLRSGGASDSPTFVAMPAGPVVPNPVGLLASPAMADVVARAGALSDLVVIDAAPVGVVGDALALTELVDGTVVVVELERTRTDALRRVLRMLSELSTPVLGLLVTNAPSPSRTSSRGAARTWRAAAPWSG